jgi:hypothetical protein
LGIGLSFNPSAGPDFRLGVLTPGFSETFAMTLTELPVCVWTRLSMGLASGDSASSSSASHGVFATRSSKRNVVGSGGIK